MGYCLDSLRLNSPGILPTPPTPPLPQIAPFILHLPNLDLYRFCELSIDWTALRIPSVISSQCFPLLTSIVTISQPCLTSDNLVPNCTSHFFFPKEPSVLPGWSFSFPDEYSGNLSPITLSSPSAQPNYPHQNSFPQILKEILLIFQSRI